MPESTQSKADKHSFIINAVIVGAGKGGAALLKIFHHDPSIKILGIADLNPAAPGMALAKQWQIQTETDYRKLLALPDVDIIIDVSGDAAVRENIQQHKSPRSELIGGVSAKFIWALVEEHQQKEMLEEKFAIMQRELEAQSKGDFIIGNSQAMREIADLIIKVAPTATPVLILGETGAGKEVIARAIHRYSELKKQPLVMVNCTAFSPNLMESELFGYKKGAFTGATSDRKGIIEEAHGGTIFLDEIGDMPMEMQAKLLRFLQSGEIRPVGSNQTHKVKVRVIAATNRNLEDAIKKGEFRIDLFYRLNAFIINLPPLRERREDIGLMALHFLKTAQERVNKRVKRLTTAALAALSAYDWPGNLRELENVIERAVILTGTDEIDVMHLPANLQPADYLSHLKTADFKEGLAALKNKIYDQIEHEALCRYLKESNGNVSHAARSARVARRTFYRLMAKHGIVTEMFT